MALNGKHILITRTRTQASELARTLESIGAKVSIVPTIEIAPPASFVALDAAISGLASYDWLIFTSVNAVEAFAKRYREVTNESVSREALQHLRVVAIGLATSRALEDISLKPDLIPPQAMAESLAEALLSHAKGARMLLIRAEQARDHLPDTLRAAGAELTIAEAYRTVILEDSIAPLRELFSKNPPNAITFTSSSTATNLFTLLDAAGLTLPAETALASIGPITSETLRALGHPPAIEAAAATIPALAEAISRYFAEE